MNTSSMPLVIVLFADGSRYTTELTVKPSVRNWTSLMAAIGNDIKGRFTDNRGGAVGFVYIHGREVGNYNANETAEILFGEEL